MNNYEQCTLAKTTYCILHNKDSKGCYCRPNEECPFDKKREELTEIIEEIEILEAKRDSLINEIWENLDDN